MAFDTTWLTGDPPAHAADRAGPLRAFRAADPTPEGAAALRDADPEGLEALAIVLEQDQDGARLGLLRDASLPKRARKAVGRAIHRLESRGVAVAAATARVGTMTFSRETLPSYLSTPLSNGAQLMILSGEQYGEPFCAYAVLTREGFEELVNIEQPSRTRLRKIVADLTDGGRAGLGMFLVQVDPAHVRARLQAGAARHRESGRPLPDEWAACARLIEEGPVHEGDHPAWAAVGETTPDHLARSAELLGHAHDDHYHTGAADRPTFDQAWQTAMLDALREAAKSPLLLDDNLRLDRLETELDRVARDTFDADLRAAEAQRLLDTAWVLHLRGESQWAPLALATARALQDDTLSPTGIPWCRQAVHGTIDLDLFLDHIDREEAGGHHDHAIEPHVHGPGCDHD